MLAAGIVLLAISGNPAAAAIIPIADSPPRFDISAACRDVGKSGVDVGRPASACQADEERARAELTARWHKFQPSARTTCVESASFGGPPSYVEVLTCLEMKKP
ncbi:MAG: hypothetical protein J0I42_13310 [Bosea sp.]|uniref:hypothetical protein n=1 Tax=Bosea sp. (in: a-proteobacteria) TaxID=1871050 RepID=UPI001AC8345C|nr:hypothetical protein [Bosea sp. (in: a-proteobacteria)]MBN9452920.1 hypothetical protein [Bosea sp. (in: a-proteobacteria)]